MNRATSHSWRDLIRTGGPCFFAWNFGLGTKLYVLGFRSFLEARYHLTKFHGTPVHYFPLTFGISL